MTPISKAAIPSSNGYENCVCGLWTHITGVRVPAFFSNGKSTFRGWFFSSPSSALPKKRVRSAMPYVYIMWFDYDYQGFSFLFNH